MRVDYKPMNTQVNWRTDYDSQSGKSSTTGKALLSFCVLAFLLEHITKLTVHIK